MFFSSSSFWSEGKDAILTVPIRQRIPAQGRRISKLGWGEAGESAYSCVEVIDAHGDHQVRTDTGIATYGIIVL